MGMISPIARSETASGKAPAMRGHGPRWQRGQMRQDAGRRGRRGYAHVLPLGYATQTLPPHPRAAWLWEGHRPCGHLTPSTYKMHTLRTTHLMLIN